MRLLDTDVHRLALRPRRDAVCPGWLVLGFGDWPFALGLRDVPAAGLGFARHLGGQFGHAHLGLSQLRHARQQPQSLVGRAMA